LARGPAAHSAASFEVQRGGPGPAHNAKRPLEVHAGMELGADHRHCKVCGRTCAPGDETCSAPCQEKREATIRTRRFYTNVMYIVIAFLAIILAISFF